ncbi:hypothetical protein [Sinorhizobium fredii]|uniref:hypothetical protein n=1 Tax=Rhizobium fredii TaxID=380 RepID=UPI001F2F822C|nr:hypothetical protein [Sinorhizobium fredii]
MDESPTHIPFRLMERRHQTIANARAGDREGTPGRHRDEFLKGDAEIDLVMHVQDEAFPPAPGRDPR